MGNKPKPPKHPGDAPKRSDKRKIIWEGDDRGRPARIIAVDMGSNDPFPCQFIYECLLKDNLHNESWGEEGNYGMSLLEKQLVFELTILNGKMPKWGTTEAEAKRDEKTHEHVKKVQVYNEYEREQAAKQADHERGMTVAPVAPEGSRTERES